MFKRWALVLTTLLLMVGCEGRAVAPENRYYTLSAEVIQTKGTRSYPGLGSDAALAVTSAALKTLGFPVTLAAGTTLKTAPKIASSIATTKRSSPVWSPSHATVYQQDTSIAWIVSVASTAGGVRITATPRAFVNGVEVSPTEPFWTDHFLVPQWTALFSEIDANTRLLAPSLPAATPAPGTGASL